MDWLEKLIKRSKRYVKNISLKKAMCIYILFAIIFVLLIWIITLTFCSGWKCIIESKYNIVFKNTIPLESLNISDNDRNLLKIIVFIKTYSIFIYTIIAIIITSKFYYDNKIKDPLNILKTEANYVARGDLSFECKYESGDEMAIICNAFNDMRLKLIEENKSMWNLIDEQSQLNAILSHVLRNPMSILEGYNEMLIQFLPEGKIDEEKLIDTLKLMNKQIIRMKEFLNKIKSVRSFSEMRIDKKKTKLNTLVNAIKEIVITIELDEGNLSIYVKDDGQGFSQKELSKALVPFYTTSDSNSSHFGIGLNICKFIAEKHGGSLTISNSINGGAIVCADFYVI